MDVKPLKVKNNPKVKLSQLGGRQGYIDTLIYQKKKLRSEDKKS